MLKNTPSVTSFRSACRSVAGRPQSCQPFARAYAVPNALVAASQDVGTLILTLAALSFLGLGQSAPAPELGADSGRNLSYFLQQWWIPVMPGLGLLVLALVGNIAGDCLRNLMKTS